MAHNNPDWRWVLWMATILTGVSVLVAFFFQAETNFERPPETEDGEGFEASQLQTLRNQAQHRFARSLSFFGWRDRCVSWFPKHSYISVSS